MPYLSLRKITIQTPKVLVVDDEYLIRWALAHALRDAGYEVTAVEDGRKAIDLAEKEHFDFVVTDLAMPGVDGWGVLETVVQMQTPPGVIVITSQVDEQRRRRVREKGGLACVDKSCLIEGVKSSLKAASGR